MGIPVTKLQLIGIVVVLDVANNDLLPLWPESARCCRNGISESQVSGHISGQNDHQRALVSPRAAHWSNAHQNDQPGGCPASPTVSGLNFNNTKNDKTRMTRRMGQLSQSSCPCMPQQGGYTFTLSPRFFLPSHQIESQFMICARLRCPPPIHLPSPLSRLLHTIPPLRL